MGVTQREKSGIGGLLHPRPASDVGTKQSVTPHSTVHTRLCNHGAPSPPGSQVSSAPVRVSIPQPPRAGPPLPHVVVSSEVCLGLYQCPRDLLGKCPKG